MMTKVSLGIFGIIVAVLMSGCSQNLAKFSVASTGNVPLASGSEKGEYVQGKACISKVFGISFGQDLLIKNPEQIPFFPGILLHILPLQAGPHYNFPTAYL